MNLLRKVPLFANEDEVCIEETEEWRLCEGELFVKAGEPAEHFYSSLRFSAISTRVKRLKL